MKGRIDTVTRFIAASPTALYQAFMQPESLVQWMPPEGMTGTIESFSPQVGGGYRMTLTYDDPLTTAGKTAANTDTVETTFSELVPGKKISGSAVFDTEDPDVLDELLMIWYSEEWEEGTKVTIIVENVPIGISKADHTAGLSSTLDHLERFVQDQQFNA